MRISALSKVPKITPMPARGASTPHKATVESSSKATAAASPSWSNTGQGSLGTGDQQPCSRTRTWPGRWEVGQTGRSSQGRGTSRSEGYVSEPRRKRLHQGLISFLSAGGHTPPLRHPQAPILPERHDGIRGHNSVTLLIQRGRLHTQAVFQGTSERELSCRHPDGAC